MNGNTQRTTVLGPAGVIELAIDNPQGPAIGTAILAHPHPLFGGTMDNKVVQTMARAVLQQGWRAVRFNFRGVGQSEGVYADGVGERADMRAVLEACAPMGPLLLGGFSFGAAVASHVVAEAYGDAREVSAAILIGTAASRFEVASLPPAWCDRTLVVHGELDDTVPLASVMDWARPQGLCVSVVPGGEHFFHGRLPQLKALVVRHLGGVSAV